MMFFSSALALFLVLINSHELVLAQNSTGDESAPMMNETSAPLLNETDVPSMNETSAPEMNETTPEPSMNDDMGEEAEMTTPPETEEPPLGSILDVLMSLDETHYVLANTIQGMPEVMDLFNDTSSGLFWTVFLPTNDAVLNGGVSGVLLQPDYAPHLEYVIRYHVIPDQVLYFNNLTDKLLMNTSLPLEEPVQANWEAGGRIRAMSGPLFSHSHIEESDLVASNGIVHTVDRVWRPERLGQTWADNLPLQGTSKFTEWIALSGLDVSYLGDSGITMTLLLPSDEAVDKALEEFPELVDRLSAMDKALAAALVLPHVVQGIYPLVQFEDGVELTTANNQSLTVSNTGGDIAIASTTVSTTLDLSSANNVAFNGLAHLVDTVLVPPVEDWPEPLVDEDDDDDTEAPPSDTGDDEPGEDAADTEVTEGGDDGEEDIDIQSGSSVLVTSLLSLCVCWLLVA